MDGDGGGRKRYYCGDLAITSFVITRFYSIIVVGVIGEWFFAVDMLDRLLRSEVLRAV